MLLLQNSVSWQLRDRLREWDCGDEQQEHGGAPQGPGGGKAGGNIYIEEARLQRVDLRGTMCRKEDAALQQQYWEAEFK